MDNINSIKTDNIDVEIKNIDNVISENIEKSKEYDRGFMAQNILTRLRNLIEHTALKILSNVKGIELEVNYPNIEEAVKYIKNIAKYKFLSNFHRFVQNSVGHITPTNENAELIRHIINIMEKLLKRLIALVLFVMGNLEMADITSKK